ncbi:MAG: hypothetical protein JO279_14220 [Verrucomicrobia bacterium]|nr:hypothetical protein [Verrucomicrobiota bacterium]
MMNSIRPDALASLHQNGEAKNGNRPGKGERQFRCTHTSIKDQDDGEDDRESETALE